MIRISNIKIYENISDENIIDVVIEKYKIPKHDILEWHISKKSVDARKKNDVHYSFSIDISLKDEDKFLKNKNVIKVKNVEFPSVNCKMSKSYSPVIIGAGPAGLFAALTFVENGYSPIVIEQGQCVDDRKVTVDNFIKNFDNPKGKNLLFTGSPGLGKTFLSNCIAKELIDSGKIVLYQTAPAMLDNIVDCKFGKNTVSKEFIDNIFESDLLIIDDLGTETMNNIKFTELFNVINTRILDNKKTIISTNLSIQNLFSIYDERIVSRIVGYYDICKFFGDDIRFKIRNIK